MKILVISDIHENEYNLQKILDRISEFSVDTIFCLGDVINSTIGKMIAGQKIPTYLVWWNNDGNRLRVYEEFMKTNNSGKISHFEFMECEIDWRKIFLTHYPILARHSAKSWEYDAVFYGHNHIKHQENIWDCLMLNPWDVCATKTWISSFAIYDTDSNSWEIFDVPDSLSVRYQ